MRFFTPEWHGGDMPADDAALIPDQYAKHLASIAARLSHDARLLAHGPSMHDGQFGEARITHRTRELVLSLRCGDRQVGYFDQTLSYQGVDLAALDRASLAAAVQDPDTDLLYDEVDATADGRAVHRILFWPYREVEIVFDTVEITSAPAPDRATRPRVARFHDVGAPVG